MWATTRPGRNVPRLRLWTLGLLLALAFLTVPAGAQAFPGALDPSFGVGGVALTSIGDGDALAAGVAATPDGGEVAAGSAVAGGSLELSLARYTSAGALDSAFGSGGIVLANLGATTSQANAVAVAPNGDIVVAGSADTSGGNTDVLLAEYSPTGQLVSGFHSGGGPAGTAVIAVGDGTDAQANAIVMDGGSVLVAGQAAQGGNTESFFDSVNTSTGSPGTPRLLSLGDGTSTIASAIALAGSNAVLAGSTENSGVKQLAVSELTAGGAPVSGFGTSGSTVHGVGTADAVADGVAVEAGGRIVVSGSVVDNSNTDLLLAGFTAAGALDSGFGTSGVTEIPVGTGGNATGSAVALTPAGQLAVAGQAADTVAGQPANLPMVARLSSSGALDSTFAPSSSRPGTELLQCQNDSGFSSAFVQSNGEVVAAGNDGADPDHEAFLTARIVDGQSGSSTSCTPVAGGGGGGGGGGSKPPPSTGCTTSTRAFGILVVRACFTEQGTRILAKSNIDIDGLAVVPSPCTSLIFDKAAGTIRTSCSQGGAGEVAVSLGGIPLYRGSLNWSIPTSSGASLGPITAGEFADLKGFAIVGQINAVAVSGGNIDVDINTDLPAPFDVFHGAATLQANINHGLELHSLDISASDVPLGPVIASFSVSYDGSTDTWTGAGDAHFPDPLTYDASAGASFQDGHFEAFKGSVGGLNLPLGAFVSLQSLNFGFAAHPFTVEGGIGVSLGPEIGGANIIGVNAEMVLEVPNPGWDIRLDGNASVAGINLASAYVEVDSPTGDGVNVYLGANVDWNADVLAIHAGVNGWMDLTPGPGDGNFDATADASVSVFGVGLITGKVSVSSTAIAMCANPIPLIPLKAGVAYVWGQGLTGFGGCDLSPYEPTEPKPVIGSSGGIQGLARHNGQAAAVTSDQLTVASHTSALMWAVKGAGAAPQLTVSGPGGEQFVSGANGAAARGSNYFTMPSAAKDTTYVMLARPAAGKWLITPHNGVTIDSIAGAGALPPPHVRASVSGRAHARVLRYAITRLPGQSVRFLEQKGKFASPIAKTGKSKGTVRFSPAYGPRGRREIVAQVLEGDTVRRTLNVASYVAPANLGPGRPRHLSLRRAGSAIRLSWRSGGDTKVYLVTVRESDGTDRALLVHGPHAKVSALPGFAGAKITVAGRSPYGGVGPSAAFTLPTPRAPKLRRAPRITGHPAVSSTVTCATGSWTGAPTRYVTEWLSNGVTIAGADRRRLRLASTRRGAHIACLVTARNGAGYGTAQSSAVKVGKALPKRKQRHR